MLVVNSVLIVHYASPVKNVKIVKIVMLAQKYIIVKTVVHVTIVKNVYIVVVVRYVKK